MKPAPTRFLRLIDGSLILESESVSLHPVHKVPTWFFRMRDLSSGERAGIINLRLDFGSRIDGHPTGCRYLLSLQE
jgi:hypothetical protein